MPVMRDYSIVIETAVEIRDSTGLLITRISVGSDATATSHMSNTKITPTVERKMNELIVRLRDHMQDVESHELERLRR